MALHPFSTPISANFVNGAAIISLCDNINVTNSLFVPFYNDQVAGLCSDARRKKQLELKALVLAIKAESGSDLHQPAGFIIHAMRVGSTAAANMLSAHPDVVVYKEANALTDVLLWPLQTAAVRKLALTALRLVVHIFHRAAASQRLSEAKMRGQTHDVSYALAKETRVVFKLASASTSTVEQLALLRAAFPTAKFAYIVRDPATSVASLLSLQPGQAVHDLAMVPCLRRRGVPPPAQPPSLLRRAGANDPLSLSMEQYCSAHLATLHDAMIAQVRNDAKSLSAVVDHSGMPDAILDIVAPHFLLTFTPRTRSLALEHATLDAKDPGKASRGYAPRVPSAAARRWATAYASVTYAALRYGAHNLSARAVAEQAEAAARADTQVGLGSYAHSAGLQGARLARNCDVMTLPEGHSMHMHKRAADFVAAAETGMDCFRAGDIMGAESCWAHALTMGGTDDQRAATLQNLIMAEGILSRRQERRIAIGPIQLASPEAETYAAAMAALAHAKQHLISTGGDPSFAKADPSVAVFDGVLSGTMCETIIAAFEGPGVAEHYVGNVGGSDGFVVRPESKLDTEIDISHSPSAMWDGVDMALTQALIGALHAYAHANPGLMASSQLFDEGFRLKRYARTTSNEEPPQHHTWHADSSGSASTGCRMIAALFYLNDVAVGGETIFMSPRATSIQPKRGRLLLFPASFAYFHAGAAPISHDKYVASNFVGACVPADTKAFPPKPVLSVERIQAMREQWGAAPPSSLFISIDQLQGAARRQLGATAAEDTPTSTDRPQLSRQIAHTPSTISEESGVDSPAKAVEESTSGTISSPVALDCGVQFRQAVAAALTALEHPVDCTTARLLVLGTASSDFEGLGSVLMQVAHGLAEAYYSNRTLVWGPKKAHPPIMSGAECDVGWGHSCFFEPLSRCAWDRHVYREEARRVGSSPFADASRVRLQNLLRGALALYAPPPHLSAVLPEAVRASAAAAAECWAGTVFAHAHRLRPSVLDAFGRHAAGVLGPWAASLGETKDSGDTPASARQLPERLSGVHLRAGDVAYLKATTDHYANRDLATAATLASALSQAWRDPSLPSTPPSATPSPASPSPPTATRVVYLATDANDSAAVSEAMREALQVHTKLPVHILLAEGMYRPEHGAHAAAFASGAVAGEYELSLPYDISAKYASLPIDGGGAEHRAASHAHQERVRFEALFDLHMLASCTWLAAAASSTFAVAARLWAVGRGNAPTASATRWVDVDGVVSGALATGFMRGMRKGTSRMPADGERYRVALSRMLGRQLQSLDPPFTIDATTALPLVPLGLFHVTASRWALPVVRPGTGCSCNISTLPVSENDGACDVAELTNEGAQKYDGELMNWQDAEACWQRALMVPGRTRHAFKTATAAAEVADVARSNLNVLRAEHAKGFNNYGPAAQPVRGSTAPAGNCSHLVRVHIEGWRHVLHSYAVAAADLVAELSRRPCIELSWSDAPAPARFAVAATQASREWSPSVQLLPHGSVPAGDTVVLRMSWPYNLSAALAPARSREGATAKRLPLRTLVFATAEHLACPLDALQHGSPSWRELTVSLITPSLWSLEGLRACGVPGESIHISPHGVGPHLLSRTAVAAALTGDVSGTRAAVAADAAALAKKRATDRAERGWVGRFVFLHVGAATPNKNLPVLVRAFAKLLGRYLASATAHRKKNAKRRTKLDSRTTTEGAPLLVLKGLDMLYDSSLAMRAAVEASFPGGRVRLPSATRANAGNSGGGADDGSGAKDVGGWDRYVELIGDDMSQQQMAALYRAADAYVTASMAEAFQMPLAEATAAGIGVITPIGGAAEEVVDSASAVLVPAALQQRQHTGSGSLIMVDEEQLSLSMELVFRNESKAAKLAAQRGPLWAATWLSIEHSADTVLAAVAALPASDVRSDESEATCPAV